MTSFAIAVRYFRKGWSSLRAPSRHIVGEVWDLQPWTTLYNTMTSTIHIEKWRLNAKIHTTIPKLNVLLDKCWAWAWGNRWLNRVIGKQYVWYENTAWLHDDVRRHQMETFSALLAIYAGNSPVSGEFSAVTRSFDIFFYLRLNNRLSKQSWGWWFETLSCPLWRHCNDLGTFCSWASTCKAFTRASSPFTYMV